MGEYRVAESDKAIFVEAAIAFPPESNKREFFPGQGHPERRLGAHLNRDAAWYHPEPDEAAKSIERYIAF